MSEVKVVYKCFVCPKAFGSVQALRGHMRVHRGVEVGDLHVRLPKAKIEEFLAFCRRHNASSCHMVLSMIDAYIEGDKRGLIQVGSPNPAIVHLMQIFPGRARGHNKYELDLVVQDPLSGVLRCPRLDHRDTVPGRLGWCRDVKRWVTPDQCLSCVH
jgi:hypothetical protein